MTIIIIPSPLCGRGVGTLVEPAKNEPCETACRMAEGGILLIVIPNLFRNLLNFTPSPLLKGEGRGEGLFIMSLRTGIKSFVVENSKYTRVS